MLHIKHFHINVQLLGNHMEQKHVHSIYHIEALGFSQKKKDCSVARNGSVECEMGRLWGDDVSIHGQTCHGYGS